MLSQEDNVAEIRWPIRLQISSHIGNTTWLGHAQDCVRNLLDFAVMERVEVYIENVRIDSSPVVVDKADEV